VVQNFITSEGRFSTTFRYHMIFLLHLNGDTKMNITFFLLKSLHKMENKIKTHPESAQHSLFHQGLIKLLVSHKGYYVKHKEVSLSKREHIRIEVGIYHSKT
jgi:hypothetical protein